MILFCDSLARLDRAVRLCSGLLSWCFLADPQSPLIFVSQRVRFWDKTQRAGQAFATINLVIRFPDVRDSGPPRRAGFDMTCTVRVLHSSLFMGVIASMSSSTTGLSLILLLTSSAVFGQSSRPLAFEVATVKQAAPTTSGGRASSSGNTVIYNNTTLLNALGRAFGITSADQIVGPTWINQTRYDIVAKAPDNTPKEQIPLMLQTLLIDRFKLVLHHETRDLPAYALVMGSGRLKLVEDEGNPENSTVLNDGRREMKSMNMVALARFATLTLRLPVVDKTGLSSHYDFQYELTQEETGRDSAPSIFTVIADLGLKLESRKEPFDVIVIDAGDNVPTEN